MYLIAIACIRVGKEGKRHPLVLRTSKSMKVERSQLNILNIPFFFLAALAGLRVLSLGILNSNLF